MKIPILMYHQIDQPPPRGTPLRGLVVSPSSFRMQMCLLKLLGYQGKSMRDLEPYLLGHKSGKVVGITFDDGYQNNLVHALPALTANGFTATCYGVSSLIGGTNIWDTGLVASKPLMTQADWQQWRDAGMDIGSHTCRHANLTEINAETAAHEIGHSRTELERSIGCEVRHFCYPYGKFREEHRDLVEKVGYTTATSTRRGRVNASSDMHALPRIMIARATSPIQFLLKILTSYEDRKS